jgi:hypothetical protein
MAGLQMFTFRHVNVYMFACLMAGCVKEPPPTYITSELPEIPEHCQIATKPTPPEPKLAVKDHTDIDAVKDREAWKRSLRVANAYRVACHEELKAVLGKRSSKPTS